MKARTIPRRRQAARRLAAVRSSWIGGDAAGALTSRRLPRLGLLELVVDLLVDAREAALEIGLRARDVLRNEALERFLVGRADARDRRRRRVRIAEDVEEGLEAGQRRQRGRLQRGAGGRDVLDPVRELRESRRIGAEVLEQQPGLALVLRGLRDADDAAGDVAGAVEVLLVVGHGEGGGAVAELRRFLLDEVHPPLTVHVHRNLAGLEGVRRRERVAGARVEATEVVVAVPVDEALLPAQLVLPRGRVEARLVAVHPLRAPRRPVVRGDVLVPARERVEADDLQLAVRVAPRELLRHRGELRDRLRRALVAGLREQRLVVVETVGVRQHREGAPGALEGRVVARSRREDRVLDAVLLHVRAEVDPGAARAKGAG